MAGKVAPRLDIQGLRAVAVGLVVLDHAGVAPLGGGFVGVDVFFVVSGFLITSLLLREAERGGRIDIAAFYARRARRILPAATVVLVVTVVLATVLLPLVRARQVAEDAAWSSLFLANVHFARSDTDYFAAGGAPSPLQHFWSLGVEEQFYLGWPLLVAVTVWLARRRSTARRSLLWSSLIVAGTASFLYSLHLLDTNPVAAYFSTLGRVWELGVGALLAVIADQVPSVPAWLRGLMATLGLGCIAASAVLIDHQVSFPGWAAVPPVLGAAAVLAAGIPEVVGPARLLTLRPMVLLGDVSYSFYLWHWPVLLLGARWLPSSTGAAVVLVGVALALAVLSFRLVETPFRERAFWRPTRRSLALWPVALACTAVAVVGVQAHVQRTTDRLAAQSDTFDPSSVPPELRTARTGNRVHDLIALSLDRAAVGAPIPFPLVNDVTALGRDRPTLEADCYATILEVGHDLCPVGEIGGSELVALVGDSHAYMWVPALDLWGKRHHLEVVPLIKFGCTPYDLLMLDGVDGPPFPACTEHRAWVNDQLARLDPDVVLTASRNYPHRLLVGRPDKAEWSEAVERTVTQLRGHGADVRVLADVSLLATDPAECLLTEGATMTDCTRPMNRHVKAVNKAIRIGASASGAAFVAVNRLVCVGGRCPMVVDQVVTYHDGQHLSATWVRRVAEDFGRMLALGP